VMAVPRGVLGEEHTSADQKLVQARVLDGLAQKSRAGLGNGVSSSGVSRRVGRWTAASWMRACSGDRLVRRGSSRFEYYRPVMDARVGMVEGGGSTCPRDPALCQPRRPGIADRRAAREVGPVDSGGSPQHRYWSAATSRHGGGDAAGWFDNMYSPSACGTWSWRAPSRQPGEGETMVVVAGAGQSRTGSASPVGSGGAGGQGLQPRGGQYCPHRASAPPEGTSPVTGGGGGGRTGTREGPVFPCLADFVGVFADSGGSKPTDSGRAPRLREGGPRWDGVARLAARARVSSGGT